jgi:hypothetical protein
VGSIASRARGATPERGITGLLVFDGQRFCQHLEGPREAVDALMQQIEDDPRHIDIRVVYAAPLRVRRYTGFGMGWPRARAPT